MSVSAELLADSGAAVAAAEFFRSTEFMAAEGVTHTLRIPASSGELLAPLIVRSIAGHEALDASSPYGYPGFVAPAGPGLDPGEIDWSDTGLVSVFIRHRLDTEPPLAGASERSRVCLFDPALPPKSRMSDRQQIRRNLRRGYRIELLAGPRASASQRGAFARVYEQSMRRANASQRYFFAAEYFERILAFSASWLVIAVEPGGSAAAASIVVRSDGMLHYFLSGTADERLGASPMKNIVAALSDLARELSLPLNLGGGIRPGDRLEEFKRGFANGARAWHTSELICDSVLYEQLSEGAQSADFFPAYRAGLA